MPSIETMGHALVYKVDKKSLALSELPNTPERTAVRVYARALAGMQKEALVCYGPTGTVWRMVSDEGPYLNGTDLAPFPLAFFTTGMALSFVEELEKHAKTRGVELTSVSLLQDNYYSMQGSALRGDMIGGALPAKLVVELEADTSEAVVREMVTAAAHTSPAQAYMRDVLENTFALSWNDQPIPVQRVAASPNDLITDPAPSLMPRSRSGKIPLRQTSSSSEQQQKPFSRSKGEQVAACNQNRSARCM
jgi:hypothetical protein